MQSNFLLALSYFCKYRNIKLKYYIKPLPRYLKQNISGNYKIALDNKTNFIEIDDFNKINKVNSFFVNQGGKDYYSSYGFQILAKEIENDVLSYKIKNPYIFLPSGSGISAFYLSNYCSIPVMTTPCIGDEIYLKKQWKEIGVINKIKIINTAKKYHFGKCYQEFLDIYKKTKKQIEFDLLYDSKGFLSLEENYNINYSKNYNIIYIHGGGISGNSSMLERYNFKEMYK